MGSVATYFINLLILCILNAYMRVYICKRFLEIKLLTMVKSGLLAPSIATTRGDCYDKRIHWV